MTANEPKPDGGYEADEPTDETTDDAEVLATRLRSLASRIGSDLRTLAADVEDGAEVDRDDVEDALGDLDRAGSTLRRHMVDVEDRVEAPVEDRDLSTFGEVDGDVERLREAPAPEVARKLAEDVLDLRTDAERVDRALYEGDLTDVHAGDLWDSAGRVEAWARDVLVHRTDRDLRSPEPEDDAVEGEAVEDRVEGLDDA